METRSLSLQTFFAQLSLALFLGSLIGLERQWHRRLIDLKTNALVCLGAALFMSVCATLQGYVDVVHMAGQVVVGVGFLGGGLLFRDGGHNGGTVVRGINTAATLWCSAAVGTLCGMGRLIEATVAAVVLVSANTVLRDVARRLNMSMGLSDPLSEQVVFDVECSLDQVGHVRDALEAVLRAQLADLRGVSEQRTARQTCQLSVTAVFEHNDTRAHIERVLHAADTWAVQSVSWRRT